VEYGCGMGGAAEPAKKGWTTALHSFARLLTWLEARTQRRRENLQ
jgi:hypothetical protein